MAMLDGLRSVFMQSLKFCKNKLAYDFLVEKWNKECEEVYKYKQALIAEERAKHTPTADVVEVVRCKDCKYRHKTAFRSYCMPVFGLKQITDLNAFCSYGERRDT